ncbi:MAG: tRNA (adenosine(37)-N6)-threonylcarbamoyltransferase complex dimerization subunit type 1 TsaB [Firmicutes bacterium]|nr:tRNA (adenosine(37)-N6)-threonylcarbamoyltransferase complex dimerization subunit type 1 TsaB [Bacillota bacterium]
MICLAIDVSGRALSGALALSQPPGLAGEFCLDTGKNHSLALLPMVDALLANCGLTLSAVDAFSVTLGPGSFTGLRIGLATVKAWCDGLDKPAVGVSSTEAMARAIDHPGLVCPVFDARRSEVYAALFRDGQRLSEDLALAPAALADLLDGYAEPVTFGGDGLAPWEDELRQRLGSRFRAVAPERRLNMAAAAAMIGLERLERGELTPAAELLPVYLRLSEAEEKLLQRQGRG